MVALAQLNDDLEAVVERTRRSLVQIANGRGAGSGTIWHGDGLIITNAHVADRPKIDVLLPDGRQLRARVLAFDAKLDLAALSVEATDLPTVELGDSRELRPGELVFAIGHPWGVAGAVTAGVVIGGGSEWLGATDGTREWLVADLHVRPGHSGGPMVDARGRLVGINTLMNGPDVGVAVPVHVVKAFLRGALGTARVYDEVTAGVSLV